MKKLVIVAAGVAFLLLVSLGLFAACVVRTGSGVHFGFGQSEKASRQETRPLELAAGKLLDVDVRTGTIRVTATSDGAPSVSAKLTAFGGTQEKADRALAELVLDVENTADGARVRVRGEQKQEKSFFDSITVTAGFEADLEIRVPAGVRLDVRSDSGDVSGTGPFAGSKLHSSYGAVEVRDVEGDLDATSSSGEVSVRGTKGKKLVAKSKYGDVHVADSESLDADVHSNSGDVTLENVHGERVRVGSSYGGVELRNIRGELEAKLSSGDVALKDWSGSRATVSTSYGGITVERATGPLEARSSSGDVRVREYEGALVAHSSYGTVDLSGVFTGLEADSSSGDVTARARAGSRVEKDWKLSSSYGGVTLVVPEGFGCHLDAKTSYGAVSVDPPLESDPGAKKKKGSNSVRGKLNGGGGSVELHCTSGDVKVESSGKE
jgi:DUF4097 and DUF4098 domain-containing protein YvlB